MEMQGLEILVGIGLHRNCDQAVEDLGGKLRITAQFAIAYFDPGFAGYRQRQPTGLDATAKDENGHDPAFLI